MCGIAGWFSPLPNAIESPKERLAAMVRTIAHRGPDGEGMLLDGQAALGHVRLAIIDLSGGQQPMTSDNGEITIIYNGEIYNHDELRQELMTRGCVFRTVSDTEVIIQVYQQFGCDGFSRLRGMYAFVMWDRRYQQALLVRDPVGIKPLFYHQHADGSLQFGSEAKAILPAIPTSSLDEGALHLLMNFRYLPGTGTLFKDIHQVQPGTILTWQAGKALVQQNIPPYQNTGHTNIVDTLRDAVACHLVSDVEVGAYLSGGVDSATVVALANQDNPRPLRTFTLDVGDVPEEARNARRSAQLLNSDNLLLHPTQSSEQVLRQLIWHLELPKVNAWQVDALATGTAKHVKVALSGLGGDELFYGYNIHRWMYLASAAHRLTPKWISTSLGYTLTRVSHVLSAVPWSEPERACRILSSLGDWPRVYALFRNVWDRPTLRAKIYGPRMLDAKLPDAHEYLYTHWPSLDDPVAAAGDFEWNNKLVNDLLWQEDRCSMAVGLEVRVPFLDLNLTQHVRALDREHLMPEGRRKGLMQDLIQPILPSEIMQRPKSGFQVDASDFFALHLSSLADTWLTESKIREYGLFNPEFVSQIRKQKPRKRLRWHYFMLYLMLTTHMWIDLFETESSTT